MPEGSNKYVFSPIEPPDRSKLNGYGILWQRLLHLGLPILLMIPAIWESARELATGGWSTIYSSSHIEAADNLYQLLPRRAIVVADSTPFSVVTLGGRFLYKGYDGTLWSHGIRKVIPLSRASFQSDLSALGTCTYGGRPITTCPDFLLWSSEEQNLWHRTLPPEEWEPTALSWIYKRRR